MKKKLTKHFVVAMSALLVALTAVQFSVWADTADAARYIDVEKSRETIATLRFDDSFDKAAGETIKEFKETHPIPERPTYTQYVYGEPSDRLRVESKEPLSWSPEEFYDESGNSLGVLPVISKDNATVRLYLNSKDYQFIRVEMNVARNEGGETDQKTFWYYPTNYFQEDPGYEGKPIALGTTVQPVTLDFTNSWIELPNKYGSYDFTDRYNTIEIDLSASPFDCVLADIKVTGVPADPEKGRMLLYGDYDYDGKITISDVTAAQKLAAGYQYQQYDWHRGGYNKGSVIEGNTSVSVMDATYVQFYLAEIDLDDNLTGTREDKW